MTDPFMRVDISQSSRDFQPVALEPGLPFLDRANSNCQTVRKWLGRFVADPERTGDRVSFYVLDDEARRIDSVFCVPVSDKDLAGELSKEFKELQKRCDSIKTSSAKDQLIHRSIAEQFRNISDNNDRDRRISLFKFRDGKNKLHLVWAPGYRRRDAEPAVPLVCTNPSCLQLFLRRGDSSPKCYACNTVRRETALDRQPRNYAGALTKIALCIGLIALGAAGTIWWQQGKHVDPSLNRPNESKDLVADPSNQEPTLTPVLLRWAADQNSSITVPVGAEFFDWNVEFVSGDGTVSDVSKQVTLAVDLDTTTSTNLDSQTPSSIEQATRPADDPRLSAVSIRNGRMIGVTPGKSTVHAVYGSHRTPIALNVVVTADLDVDEIRIVPAKADLTPGESISLKAIGYKSGQPVGEITNRGDLLWKPENDELIRLDGPQVNAKAAGSTSVVASIGAITSKPSSVAVHNPEGTGRSPAALGKLTVAPTQLRIRAGEIVRMGHEIRVQRNELDVTGACEVVVSSARSMSFDDSSGTLHALSPGRSQVTFVLRDQFATLNVEVEPSAAPVAKSRVVIEPASGILAVGEKCPLRVFTVTPDGLRMALPCLLSSHDVKTAIVDGTEVQGVASGEVIVEAQVPGIDQVGRAIFQVEPIEFDRLTFHPASLSVAIGQRKLFEILGVTRRGRLRLGDDPNLKFTGVGPGQESGTDLSGPECYEVIGLSPGSGSIVAKWKGGLEQRMPVAIRSDRILELMILPEQSSLAEGTMLDYQIMARREGRLQPLDQADGVELIVDDPQIATARDMRLTAVKAGATNLVAKYGNLRATGRLSVTPRSQPQPVASPATPPALRFLTDILQLELGDTSSPVRVVRVLSDGSEEAVDERLTFKVKDPQTVADLDSTATGSVIQAKVVGTTSIEASLGNLNTLRPLLVQVVPKIQRQPELRTRPGSLRLLVGETKKFLRADILLGATGEPIPIPFTVSAIPNKTIEVKSDGSIRGLAAGTALVVVTAKDSDGRFGGIENFAVVEVVNP